jgi:hypothetical protein
MTGNHPEDVAEILSKFGELGSEQRARISAESARIFSDQGATAMQRLTRVIEVALGESVALPESLIAFSRAQQLLDAHFDRINQAVGSLRHNTAEIYARVAKRRILEGLAKSARSLGTDTSVVVTPEMIARYLSRNPLEARQLVEQLPTRHQPLARAAMFCIKALMPRLTSD